MAGFSASNASHVGRIMPFGGLLAGAGGSDPRFLQVDARFDESLRELSEARCLTEQGGHVRIREAISGTDEALRLPAQHAGPPCQRRTEGKIQLGAHADHDVL